MKLRARDMFDPQLNFWEKGTLVRSLTAEEGRAIISAYRILKGEHGRLAIQREMDLQRASTQYGNMLKLIFDLIATGKGAKAKQRKKVALKQAQDLLAYYDPLDG